MNQEAQLVLGVAGQPQDPEAPRGRCRTHATRCHSGHVSSRGQTSRHLTRSGHQREPRRPPLGSPGVTLKALCERLDKLKL